MIALVILGIGWALFIAGLLDKTRARVERLEKILDDHGIYQ